MAITILFSFLKETDSCDYFNTMNTIVQHLPLKLSESVYDISGATLSFTAFTKDGR